MRFHSGSSEVNVHSAFHVSRSFKVGREVINRDALFCPKTSMYDSSQPHHCNTISVETTISRRLFCRSSLAIFLIFHLINTLLSFCFISTQSEYLSLSLMPNVWGLELNIFWGYLIRYLWDSVAWLKDKTSLFYVKMKVAVGWLCLHAVLLWRVVSACRRVPVGCSWDCNSFAVFAVR